MEFKGLWIAFDGNGVGFTDCIPFVYSGSHRMSL